MTGQVTVQPGAIESFGATAASAGTAAVAGASVGGVGRAALVAAFGLIGQEFLAAYALAEVNHLDAVADLAATHAATAAAASAATIGYHSSDAASGTLLAGR